MPGNGVLAVAECVEQAYLRLELVEHLAKMDYYARSMGTPMELADADVASLMEKRASIGLGPKKRPAISLPETKSFQEQQQSSDLKRIILEEIKKALQSLPS